MPLGVRSYARFEVVNDGYDNLELKFRLVGVATDSASCNMQWRCVAFCPAAALARASMQAGKLAGA